MPPLIVNGLWWVRKHTHTDTHTQTHTHAHAHTLMQTLSRINAERLVVGHTSQCSCDASVQIYARTHVHADVKPNQRRAPCGRAHTPAERRQLRVWRESVAHRRGHVRGGAEQPCAGKRWAPSLRQTLCEVRLSVWTVLFSTYYGHVRGVAAESPVQITYGLLRYVRLFVRVVIPSGWYSLINSLISLLLLVD